MINSVRISNPKRSGRSGINLVFAIQSRRLAAECIDIKNRIFAFQLKIIFAFEINGSKLD